MFYSWWSYEVTKCTGYFYKRKKSLTIAQLIYIIYLSIHYKSISWQLRGILKKRLRRRRSTSHWDIGNEQYSKTCDFLSVVVFQNSSCTKCKMLDPAKNLEILKTCYNETHEKLFWNRYSLFCPIMRLSWRFLVEGSVGLLPYNHILRYRDFSAWRRIIIGLRVISRII